MTSVSRATSVRFGIAECTLCIQVMTPLPSTASLVGAVNDAELNEYAGNSESDAVLFTASVARAARLLLVGAGSAGVLFMSLMTMVNDLASLKGGEPFSV